MGKTVDPIQPGDISKRDFIYGLAGIITDSTKPTFQPSTTK